MNNQSLRWLNEEGAAMWRGYYRGDEVAAVWPSELARNQISVWHWKVEVPTKTGSVRGTGNDELDTYAAQWAANNAFFEELS